MGLAIFSFQHAIKQRNLNVTILAVAYQYHGDVMVIMTVVITVMKVTAVSLISVNYYSIFEL